MPAHFMKSDWTPEQHAFAQSLREGPTAAIEHFRSLWNARPPGLLSQAHLIVAHASVLADRFRDPQENLVPDIPPGVVTFNELGEEFWKVIVDTRLFYLVLEIMSDPSFIMHDWVRLGQHAIYDCCDVDFASLAALLRRY